MVAGELPSRRDVLRSAAAAAILSVIVGCESSHSIRGFDSLSVNMCERRLNSAVGGGCPYSPERSYTRARILWHFGRR